MKGKCVFQMSISHDGSYITLVEFQPCNCSLFYHDWRFSTKRFLDASEASVGWFLGEIFVCEYEDWQLICGM